MPIDTEAPDILLTHYLKALKLPTFQPEHQKLARLRGSEQSPDAAAIEREDTERPAVRPRLLDTSVLDRSIRSSRRIVGHVRFSTLGRRPVEGGCLPPPSQIPVMSQNS